MMPVFDSDGRREGSVLSSRFAFKAFGGAGSFCLVYDFAGFCPA